MKQTLIATLTLVALLDGFARPGLHQLPDQQRSVGRRLDHHHLLGRLAHSLRRAELHPRRRAHRGHVDRRL